MTINRDTLLRIIICVDFVFVSMVLMADWLPNSYIFNQATILVLGFAAIVYRENVIQVELLMLIKFMSIIIDSIAIGMYFQIGKSIYSQRFDTGYFVLSAFFAIFLLILKPIMLLLLNKVREERLGDASFGNWAPTSGYTSLDGR